MLAEKQHQVQCKAGEDEEFSGKEGDGERKRREEGKKSNSIYSKPVRVEAQY